MKDKPSRYPSTSAISLDRIYTYKMLQNCWPTPGILKFNISDYLPTFWLSQCKVHKSLSKIKIVRDKKQFNVKKFCKDFCLLFQKKIISTLNNPDKAMIELINILNDTINKHAPLIKLLRKQMKIRL